MNVIKHDECIKLRMKIKSNPLLKDLKVIMMAQVMLIISLPQSGFSFLSILI